MNEMTNCKTCGAQIAPNAKVCPSCGAPNKRPVHKRVWFWVLIVFVALGFLGSLAGGTQQTEGQTGGNLGCKSGRWGSGCTGFFVAGVKAGIRGLGLCRGQPGRGDR